MFSAKWTEATLDLNDCEAASFEGLTEEYSILGNRSVANNNIENLSIAIIKKTLYICL